MLVRVQGLCHTYAPGTPLEVVALRGVSLEIPAGECVGLLGPTGSGKSTLAQLMAGLIRPTSGCVLLDRIPAHGRRAASRACRQRVGMAFQRPEHQLFRQTVFDEVAYGARQAGMRGAELTALVDWSLEMVGIRGSAVRSRNPLSLSGGEMRRVALAGILVRRPEVLILDEPTANLDPRGRADVLARIAALQKQTQMTLVLISHNLRDLVQVVQRAVMLVGGAVAADGPVAEVLSDPTLLGLAGFRVPPSVVVLRALRARGWRVGVDILSPSGAAAEIAGAVRRGVPA